MKINKVFLGVVGIFSIAIQAALLILSFLAPTYLLKSVNINSLPGSQVISHIIDKKIENINGSVNENIIYNGTTITQGIKSNSEIDKKSIELTSGAATEKEKAKILYSWVGSNIKYDDAKAGKVLNGNGVSDMPKSGAIAAFNNRTGICFDKACLYVAMAKAAGLKVRLLSGEAYDGEKYVGHAWNQVYISDEDLWINVDPTFYEAGNYFDSNLFDKHKIENIAGEW